MGMAQMRSWLLKCMSIYRSVWLFLYIIVIFFANVQKSLISILLSGHVCNHAQCIVRPAT